MSATYAPARHARALPLLIAIYGLLMVADLSGWIDLPGPQGLLKPGVTLLIAVHASRLPWADRRRRRLVLAGLVFSFLGECAMTLPAGLAVGSWLFVVAQCCYLAAFAAVSSPVRPGVVHAVHAVPVVWALAMWSARPGSVFVPVAIFMCLLGLFAAQADAAWWRARATPRAPAARSAAIAGALWLFADLAYTFSQFVAWHPLTFAWVLPAYWLAQWHHAATAGAREAVAAPAGTHGGDKPPA
jgi:hypothetical protein